MKCFIIFRSQTNPLDSIISSPKTKGSVINQAEWHWSEDSANVSQDRTGQDRTGQDEDRMERGRATFLT